MVKLMLLIRRKPGLTRQQFIDHYEGTHVPLVLRTMGHCMADYRRNYVDWDDPLATLPRGARDEIGFDVVTEITLADRAAMDAMFAIAAEPGAAAEIAADEEQFVDRAAVRMLVVEEHGGPAAG